VPYARNIELGSIVGLGALAELVDLRSGVVVIVSICIFRVIMLGYLGFSN